MRHSSKHLKPLYWGLFSVGGTIAALTLAPVIAIFCIGLPFALLGAPGDFHDHASRLAGHPVVFVALAAVLFTILWHGCHRFYYILHDMHIPAGHKTRLAFYGIAVAAFAITLFCGLA